MIKKAAGRRPAAFLILRQGMLLKLVIFSPDKPNGKDVINDNHPQNQRMCVRDAENFVGGETGKKYHRDRVSPESVA